MDFYEIVHEWKLGFVLAAWVLSFIIGLIIVQVWKGGMNTVRQKNQASAYIVTDSLMFKEKKDRFLYSTIAKIRRPSTSSSSGSALARSMGRRR